MGLSKSGRDGVEAETSKFQRIKWGTKAARLQLMTKRQLLSYNDFEADRKK